MVESSILGMLGTSGAGLPLGLDFFHIFIWPGGGAIGSFLWLLSIVMVSMIVQAFLAIRRINIIPDLIRDEIRTMFDNKQYREVIEMTDKQSDYLSFIVHAALSEAPRGYSAMEKALQDASEERKVRLVRGLEYLNLLGNVGPMVGLLGTVWGMILAFFKIVEQGGNPNASDLAGALGIKLVCTFLGLVVAIPSLVTYGMGKNRVDIMTSEATGIASDMIGTFKPGAKA
jgi:biopolymer transport protein ExbB